MKKYISMLFLIIALGAKGQSLDDFFEIAAQNNPGLQADYKSFEAAMARAAGVNSLPDPTLSFGYFISPVETRVGPQRARFSLNQMFPWFGTLRAKEDAAALLAQAEYQTFLNAKIKLKYTLAKAWYPLYELDDFKSIEQKNIEILESYKTIATGKFENGTGSLSDVLRVEILLDDAQTNLEIIEQKRKPLLTTFNSVMGFPTDTVVAMSKTISEPQLPADLNRDSLLIDNPRITALELKSQASEASQKAIGKSGLPQMGIGLTYILTDKRQDMEMPDNGKDAIMPMVSVSIPIFRKKYKQGIRQAELMQQAYDLRKTDLENGILSDYENALFEMRKQQEYLDLYTRQTATTQQTLDLLLTAYANEGEDFEEVLVMEQKLLKYQKLKATALKNWRIAIAKLNYVGAVGDFGN